MSEESTVQASAKEAPKFKAPKKKKKWVKRLIILVAALALLVFILSRCMAGGVQSVSGSYLPTPVGIQELTVAVTGPGTIKPNDSYRATTLIKGEILTAPFEEGDTVEKDDVLFTIDASDVENAIKQARTGVEQAQLSVKSAQLNYDSLLRTQSDNTKDRQVTRWRGRPTPAWSPRSMWTPATPWPPALPSPTFWTGTT